MFGFLLFMGFPSWAFPAEGAADIDIRSREAAEHFGIGTSHTLATRWDVGGLSL